MSTYILTCIVKLTADRKMSLVFVMIPLSLSRTETLCSVVTNDLGLNLLFPYITLFINTWFVNLGRENRVMVDPKKCKWHELYLFWETSKDVYHTNRLSVQVFYGRRNWNIDFKLFFLSLVLKILQIVPSNHSQIKCLKHLPIQFSYNWFN